MMPTIYREMGLPLRWQDEQGGQLKAAIHAFLEQSMEQAQIDLLRSWLTYYIEAPCWSVVAALPATDVDTVLVLPLDLLRYRLATLPLPEQAELAAHPLTDLRERVKTLQTIESINRWIQDCLEIGIDPL